MRPVVRLSIIQALWAVAALLVVLVCIALVTLVPDSEKSPTSSGRDEASPCSGSEEEAPAPYAFTLLYTILCEDPQEALPRKELYERRLSYLEGVIERESFGRMMITPKLHVVSVQELGDDRLAYSSRTVYGWIEDLERYFSEKGIGYDILIFCPATEAYDPWCTDGPSQGYSHNGKKYLCLETFLDHAKEEEDEPAAALAIHKILHGFGYNHISHENRPTNLLEWDMGLPKTRILPLVPHERWARTLFDKHIMKVLGFLPRTGFERGCPDGQGFICAEKGRFFCENSYDIRCTDADQDGIVDAEDDYLFTPYGSSASPDRDSDGIPDSLDLCDGNELVFRANIPVKKTRAIVDRDQVAIRIEPAAKVRGVNVYRGRNLRGFIGFLRSGVDRVAGNELSLDAASLSAITRLQIFYESPQGTVYKPFYLYRAPQQVEVVHEKEWFYFSRFGCDIPLGVDFSDAATYDGDLDGLPDKERFVFAARITGTYDWDADGVPDAEDSLPTVHGECSTRLVKGVPDSDGDGVCDPAYFRFTEDLPGMIEGDLAISFQEDPDADRCPYVCGTSPDGCPSP